MYVPTIAVIVVLRHYLVQGVTRQSAIVGIAAILAVGLLFFAAQFWGSLAVPEAEFVQHLQGRMADPARTNLLSFSFIWYQSLAQEIRDTWAADAVESAGRAGIRTIDLAARPALEIFCRPDPVALRSIAPSYRHRRDLSR